MPSSSVQSACPSDAVVAGHYRYALWRDLEQGIAGDTCLFVMLNPSTADAHVDDPTLRRCIGFAREWGYNRLSVANLYAWRSPKPADLATAPDPIGRECDQWIEDLASDASYIVAAWGASEHINPARALAVCEVLADAGAPLVCLQRTEDGHPCHPLYMPNGLEPEAFTWWRELYG